jgi:hypothetical protein
MQLMMITFVSNCRTNESRNEAAVRVMVADAAGQVTQPVLLTCYCTHVGPRVFYSLTIVAETNVWKMYCLEIQGWPRTRNSCTFPFYSSVVSQDEEFCICRASLPRPGNRERCLPLLLPFWNWIQAKHTLRPFFFFPTCLFPGTAEKNKTKQNNFFCQERIALETSWMLAVRPRRQDMRRMHIAAKRHETRFATSTPQFSVEKLCAALDCSRLRSIQKALYCATPLPSTFIFSTSCIAMISSGLHSSARKPEPNVSR